MDFGPNRMVFGYHPRPLFTEESAASNVIFSIEKSNTSSREECRDVQMSGVKYHLSNPRVRVVSFGFIYYNTSLLVLKHETRREIISL